MDTGEQPIGPYNQNLTLRTSDPAQPSHTIQVMGTITDTTTTRARPYRPLDLDVTIAGDHSGGEWVEFTHDLGPDPATLHPVSVYSTDGATLWGVGKYATQFGEGTASYDMFGDGRDGDLVVNSGQTVTINNTRNRSQWTGICGTNISYSRKHFWFRCGRCGFDPPDEG